MATRCERSWPEFRDLVVFLAGPTPAASPEQPYAQAHVDAVCRRDGDPAQLDKYRTILLNPAKRGARRG
ncbi:hypothetical protein [Ralstonia solanacearum]|uniref:hypothetical protein n=1 Tax=Ralstonia solanacearum TaxID=305 RepID=UPI001E2AFEF1|nr:hypothetical protein [Ralstonia solanacearum]